MKYPFEFRELLLTDHVLGLLEFTQYWSGCGDFGTRNLYFGRKSPDTNFYQIAEMDSGEQETDWGKSEYFSNHFTCKDFQKTLYFLHELYEDIVSCRPPEDVAWFIEKCQSVGMYPSLKSYLDWKELKGAVNQPCELLDDRHE